MNKPVIVVENLSKCYRIGAKEPIQKTFREAIVDGFMAPIRNLRRLRKLTRFNANKSNQSNTLNKSGSSDIIWALRDVSFAVQPGEVLGVIGRNGAGKTTLLKILSRITEPTAGEAKIYGRVSSLLEVGTGVHPELTGRENIYLNGTILGMRKAEIDQKFDEIVDFAEIGEFLDTPVKRYSSGMYVRLTFAVAAHLEPEILVVDEVLAVGDSDFQRKCLGKMEGISKEGRTVLYVSHNMTSIVTLCRSAVWIDKGYIRLIDDAQKTVHAYLASGLSAACGQVVFQPPDGKKEAYLSSLELRNGSDEITSDFDVLSPVRVGIFFHCTRRFTTLRLGAVVSAHDGITVFSTTSQDYESINGTFEPGGHCVQMLIPGQFLAAGEYYLSVGIAEPNIRNHDLRESVLMFRVTGNPFRLARNLGFLVYPFEWRKLF